MLKFTKLYSILSISLINISCSTSMTPIEVSNSLPTLTKSIYIPQNQKDIFLETNKCKLLNSGRNYVAPIGISVKDDLRNGAKGIDEWVKLDGGNAYLLKNFRWVTVNNDGTTQLDLDFDTYACEK